MAALIGVSVKPKADGSGYSAKVPLDLLAEDGVPPQEGDSVSYSVDGTVQSVDAENATIKIESVNGQPVSEDEATEPPDEAPAAPPGAPPGPPGGIPKGPGSSASLRPAIAAMSKKGPPMF